jgi:hypothetical protein
MALQSRATRLVLWALGTRLLIAAAMILGTYASRPWPRYPYWIGEANGFRWQQVPFRLLDIWGRWDTMYYLSIAEGGYPSSYPEGGWVFHAAFFPLYPTLMRGVSVLLGGIPLYYAGILVTNAMLVLALVYLDKLVRLDAPAQIAEWAVIAVLCYPGSHFLSSVYPESTALFLGVFAFYCVRTGRPAVASISAALAVLNRPNGWVIAAALGLEIWRGKKFLWLMLPIASAILFLGLHFQTYGDPLYFLHVQSAWHRKLSYPFASLLDFQQPLDHHLLALGALLVLAVAIRKRQRLSYLALCGVNLLLPLSSGLIQGIQRYLTANFPLYVFLADRLSGRTWLRRSLALTGLGALAIYSHRWGAGAWPN